MHNLNLAVALVREGWDKRNPWESAISALFSVATVMHAAGIEVPSELKFRRGLGDNRTLRDLARSVPDGYNDTTYDEFVLASEYLAGNIDDRTLTLAALTLNRYTRAAEAAGLSY